MTVIEFPPSSRISEQLGRFRFDPLGFVQFAFPWGRPGTALAGETGPEPWQREVLEKLGRGLKQRDSTPDEAVRLAVASGHGIGKSALVAWMILWAMSTLSDTRGIVTANTEGQLRTKTWPELAKWHALSVNKSWFTYTATSLHSVAARPRPHLARRCHHLVGEQHRGHRRPAQQGQARLRPVRRGLVDRRRRVGDDRGRADRCRHRPVLARLRQPHAHHRPLPRMLRRRPLRPSLAAAADRFALGVDDQQGADRHLGARLRRGFRFRARAREGRVPARRHHAVHRQRARRACRGSASCSRIRHAALVMGVDIARQGEDQTVIRFRRGLDARSIPAVKFRIPDLMAMAGRVMELVNSHEPDAVFVDGTGIGWGVVDRLDQLGCSTVRGIDFGAERRSHRRQRGRRALRQQAGRDVGPHEGVVQVRLPARRPRRCAPTSPPSTTATTPPTPSGSSARTTCARAGSASPDDGDALALTFAYPGRAPELGGRTAHPGEAGAEEALLSLSHGLPDRRLPAGLRIMSRLEAGGPEDHERHGPACA